MNVVRCLHLGSNSSWKYPDFASIVENQAILGSTPLSTSAVLRKGWTGLSITLESWDKSTINRLLFGPSDKKKLWLHHSVGSVTGAMMPSLSSFSRSAMQSFSMCTGYLLVVVTQCGTWFPGFSFSIRGGAFIGLVSPSLKTCSYFDMSFSHLVFW